jgi:hypothetical protein
VVTLTASGSNNDRWAKNPNNTWWTHIRTETLSANRVYLHFGQVQIQKNYRATLNSDFPMAARDVFISLKSHEMSTRRYDFRTDLGYSPFNFGDMEWPYPYSAYAGQYGYHDWDTHGMVISKGKFRPIISMPSQVQSLFSEWKICEVCSNIAYKYPKLI